MPALSLSAQMQQIFGNTAATSASGLRNSGPRKSVQVSPEIHGRSWPGYISRDTIGVDRHTVSTSTPVPHGASQAGTSTDISTPSRRNVTQLDVRCVLQSLKITCSRVYVPTFNFAMGTRISK